MILSVWCYDDVLTDNLIKDISYRIRCISIIAAKANKIILYNAAGSREAIKRIMQNFSNCPSVILLNFFMRMIDFDFNFVKDTFGSYESFTVFWIDASNNWCLVLHPSLQRDVRWSRTNPRLINHQSGWNLQGAQDVCFSCQSTSEHFIEQITRFLNFCVAIELVTGINQCCLLYLEFIHLHVEIVETSVDLATIHTIDGWRVVTGSVDDSWLHLDSHRRSSQHIQYT